MEFKEKVKNFKLKIKGIFLEPSKFFETVKEEPLAEAIKYFIDIIVLYLAITVFFDIFLFLFTKQIGDFIYRLNPNIYGTKMAFIFIFLWGLPVYNLIFTVIGVFILGPVIHIGIYIMGGRKRISQTLKSVIYTSPILFLFGLIQGLTLVVFLWLQWMPFLFLAVFPLIWALVVEIIGLRKLHDLTTGRAIVALIISFIILIFVNVIITLPVFLLKIIGYWPLK